MKNIYFVILALIIVAYFIISIRKNKLSIKTSFGWIIGAIAMIILSIWPKSLDWLARFIGIEYPPALFLTLCVVILFVLDFNNSKNFAEYQMKITELAQQLTLVKANVEELTNRKEDKK